MRIVVTGGAGFLGSNLVDRLMDQGHAVTVLDNLRGGHRSFVQHHLKSPRFTLHAVDIRRSARVAELLGRNTDVVYHLAANSDISRSGDDPNLDFQHGIAATFSLLQAMRSRGVRRLVYTSGSGVYGDRGYQFMRETHGSLEPVSMYGAAKLAAEGLISAFVHLFGMQACVFRPANLIGPRVTHGVVYDFVRRLQRNARELQILGDGKQSKAYVHVDDALDAFAIAVARATRPVHTYNISSRSFVSVKEIADIVVSELGLRAADVAYAYTGGPVGWKGDVSVVRLDSTAMRRLGWRPRYTSQAAVRAAAASLIRTPGAGRRHAGARFRATVTR